MTGAGGRRRAAAALRCAFFLETDRRPLSPRDPLWSRPLPHGRPTASGPAAAPPEAPWTVGECLEAAADFLDRRGRAALAGLRPPPAEIRIYLAKHGAFYHPCRVAASGREFVLNIALSEAGRSLLAREVAVLERLRRLGPPCFVPEVLAAGEVALGGGRRARLFLAPWFSGFHEFHLTRRGRRLGMVVWDPEEGDRRLSTARRRTLYRRAAAILTRYYDPATTEGIGAWHHGAGDFVVRDRGGAGGVDLRLVSAREYRPLFGRRPAPLTPSQTLETLLLFLLGLSIRMRIDRLDGTGELAWAGPEAVGGTLAGFFDALGLKPPLPGLPAPLDLLFHRYLLDLGRGELAVLCRAVGAAAFAPRSAEAALVAPHIRDHAAELAAALVRLPAIRRRSAWFHHHMKGSGEHAGPRSGGG